MIGRSPTTAINYAPMPLDSISTATSAAASTDKNKLREPFAPNESAITKPDEIFQLSIETLHSIMQNAGSKDADRIRAAQTVLEYFAEQSRIKPPPPPAAETMNSANESRTIFSEKQFLRGA